MFPACISCASDLPGLPLLKLSNLSISPSRIGVPQDSIIACAASRNLPYHAWAQPWGLCYRWCEVLRVQNLHLWCQNVSFVVHIILHSQLGCWDSNSNWLADFLDIETRNQQPSEIAQMSLTDWPPLVSQNMTLIHSLNTLNILEWYLNDIYIYILINYIYIYISWSSPDSMVHGIYRDPQWLDLQAGRWSEALQLLQAARDGVRNHRPMLTRNGGKPILCWYFLNGAWITYIYIYIWLYNNVYYIQYI